MVATMLMGASAVATKLCPVVEILDGKQCYLILGSCSPGIEK